METRQTGRARAETSKKARAVARHIIDDKKRRNKLKFFKKGIVRAVRECARDQEGIILYKSLR